MVLGIGASELAMQLSPRADALHIGQSQPTIKPPDQIWTIHQTMGVVVVIVVVVIVVVAIVAIVVVVVVVVVVFVLAVVDDRITIELRHSKTISFFSLFLSIPLLCVSARAPFHIQWRPRYIPTSSGHQVFFQQPFIILFHVSLIFEKKITFFCNLHNFGSSNFFSEQGRLPRCFPSFPSYEAFFLIFYDWCRCTPK